MTNKDRLKPTDWEARRNALECELRALVVDSEGPRRQQLDELLFRQRVPARAVSAHEQALSLFDREGYALVVIAEDLPQVGGLRLAEAIKRKQPHVDVVLTTEQPTLRMVTQASNLGLSDIWPSSLNETALSARLREVLRKQVDRQMRGEVLRELREGLTGGDEAQQRQTATLLEARLQSFKVRLGAFDRALVVEAGDANLRLFSEHLLLTGLRVETTDTFDDALARASEGNLALVALDASQGGNLPITVESLRERDPNLELIVTAFKPTVDDGILAMRERIAGYVPWPPTSLAKLAEQAQEQLWNARRDRLVDNLFVELYRETLSMTETMPFELFRTTIGLDRVTSLPEMAPLEFTAEEPEDRGRISTLSEALDAVLEEVNQREGLSEDEDDRRSHQRVAHSQFLRFRPEGNSSAVMAYLGDLSEGGIFVRTAEQPPHTTRVSVDFHVMHLDQRFRVCCPGEVAWLAEGEDDSPHGAGFGIRFVDAPTDVKELLRDIVRKRTQQAGKTPA